MREKDTSSEKIGRLRLILPAVLAWIAVASFIPFPGVARKAVLLLIVLVLLLGLSLALPAFRHRVVAVLKHAVVSLVLMLLLAASVAHAESVREDPRLLASAQSHERTVERVKLLGYPAAAASDFDDRSWVRAEIVSGGIGLMLWLDGPPDDTWAPGQLLTVEGRLSLLEITSPTRFALSVDEVSEVTNRTGSFYSVAAALRTELRAVTDAISGAELVPGLAFGDTSLVSPELEDAMQVSSLTHLTAVSGANCALVITVVIWFASRLGVPRRARLVLAGVALGGFVVIVGPDPSVQRATVMAAVMLISGFGGKRAVGLASLGAAIALLLFLDPWQAYHPGFVLSVAATGGILVFSTGLNRMLKRHIRLPSFLSTPVAVAIAAQFACSAFLILLNPGIPAAGVIANVVAAPAAPVGTGIGLLAALLVPVSSGLATFLAWVASLAARWIETTAFVTSSFPFATLHWVEDVPGAVLTLFVQVIGLIGWGVLKGSLSGNTSSRQPGRLPWQSLAETRRARPIRPQVLGSALLAVALSVTGGVTILLPVTDTLRTPRDWIVVGCDVGQGDAILLRDPAHRDVMLVDTGDDEDRLQQCLHRFGVDEIALLVLTHDDRDHVGALHAVLPRVQRAVVSPDLIGEESRDVIDQLRAAGIATTYGIAGLGGSLGDGASEEALRWRVLSPDPDSLLLDRNASSVVLKVEMAGFSTLLLADTGADEQQVLIEEAGPSIDLVKVAHHGSGDQFEELYRSIAAPFALVSVGEDNGYGHPAPETMAILDRAGTTPIRTDRHGSVAFSIRDRELHVWGER